MENVKRNIEQFRTAVLQADKKQLEELLSNDLSYGHSDGHVEGKNELIQKLSDGTYQFKTMDITSQEIKLVDNIAIVRHQLDALTNDENRPGEAHLFVLLIWQRLSANWRLIARQAVKNLPIQGKLE